VGALLNEPELLGSLAASDLNPDAIEMLMENLSRWDKRDYPKKSVPLQRLYDDRLAGVFDATKLRNDPTLVGKWDLVLVNLPHRTIELLPEIIPLLDLGTPSLIRGRVVVPEEEIAEVNRELVRILPSLLEGEPLPSLQVKRDYSSSLRLCSFEAWIGP
jgi:tRNA G37 N-methylase Trm5